MGVNVRDCQEGTDRFAVQWSLFDWNKMMLWVMQRQFGIKRQSHPFNTPQLRSFEPFGIYLDSILNLCKVIFNYSEDFGGQVIGCEGYQEWWQMICLELEIGSLQADLNYSGKSVVEYSDGQVIVVSGNTVAAFKDFRSKPALYKAIRDELAQLEKGINPYKDISLNLYNLIEACLLLAKHPSTPATSIAKSQLAAAWKAYKDAYKSLAKKIRSDPNLTIVYREGDKIKKNVTGRVVELVYPIPKLTSLRKSSKTKP